MAPKNMAKKKQANNNPRKAFDKLEDTHPLLLLPVRLETRFEGRDLKVRIYPDQVHLDEHEDDLTANELRYGEMFWRRYLQSKNAAKKREIELWLAASIPGRRATWVARQTKPEVGPDGSPIFPKRKPRETATPTRAAALPRQFAVVGFCEGQQRFVHFGKVIPKHLAMSSELEDTVAWSEKEGVLPVDANFAWMIDYDEAVKVGMGLTIPLEQHLFTDVKKNGLTLIAVGVREELPKSGAATLESLLTAHLYTDGLEFIPQGTPTNNTDVTASGWTKDIDDVQAWFDRELNTEEINPEDSYNAARLSKALGLHNHTLLTKVLFAEQDEETTMGAMNTVMWPITWGHYLNNLLSSERGPSILPRPAIGAIKQFFINVVRGGATLPLVGIGAQPYGILPVRRTREGKDVSGDNHAIERVLLQFKKHWRDALTYVPRLDPVLGDAIGSDPKDDAVEVLGALPHPSRYVVRRLNYFGNSAYFPERGWRADEVHLQNWLNWYINRLPDLENVGEQLDLVEQWEQQIDELVTGSLRTEARELHEELFNRVKTHASRQGPIDQVAADYFTGVYAPARTPKNSKKEPGIIWSDFGFYAPPLQPGEDFPNVPEQEWTRPVIQINDPGEGDSAAAYLELLATQAGNANSNLAMPSGKPLLFQLINAVIGLIHQSNRKAYRNALRTLKKLAERDIEQLELRFNESLGLATHRLDAWFTGLARKRLEAMRLPEKAEEAVKGIQLGAFGWVQDLRPDPEGTQESQGYIHAPSLGHAATAAVLRAGWNAHGDQEPNSLMAVDLRSDRVRLGGWLLDGIRQGQTLGALLGYRFERDIREDGHAEFIDACRRAVLVSKDIETDPVGPVDGLELIDLYQGKGLYLKGYNKPLKPTVTAPVKLRPVKKALNNILYALDAVADVSIADSVHHILQGNVDRASATLDAITTGAVPPPELRSTATPRPGATVSHRVMILFTDGEQKPNQGTDIQQDLAHTNTSMDAWLSQVLGPIELVYCKVHLQQPNGQLTTETISMADLGVSATNIVLEAPAGTLAIQTAWGRRIANVVASKWPDVTGILQIEFAPQVDDAEVTFQEFAQLASALRSMLGRSRPLESADLDMPGLDETNPWDVQGIQIRIDNLLSAFDATTHELEQLLAAPETDDAIHIPALQNKMVTLANLGMKEALPTVPVVDEPGVDPIEEARLVANAARKRLLVVKERMAQWHNEDQDAEADQSPLNDAKHQYRRMRQVVDSLVGKNVPLLPNFLCTNEKRTAQAFSASNTLTDNDAAAATGWLGKVARVRKEIAGLEDVITLSELIQDKPVHAPLIGQLPDQDKWVATSAPEDRRKGHLCLWALDNGGIKNINMGKPVAGLMVDTWIEQIPAPDLMTGVAMHFDAPTSRPPQSMLLMVPPKGESWNFKLVLDTLVETLEAAQLRAVDPDILDIYGHHFPAIYAPTELDAIAP